MLILKPLKFVGRKRMRKKRRFKRQRFQRRRSTRREEYRKKIPKMTRWMMMHW
jgi:hypothetical protein